jgi:hypothetical protein
MQMSRAWRFMMAEPAGSAALHRPRASPVGMADGLAAAAPRAERAVQGVNHKRIRRLWREMGLRRPA